MAHKSYDSNHMWQLIHRLHCILAPIRMCTPHLAVPFRMQCVRVVGLELHWIKSQVWRVIDCICWANWSSPVDPSSCHTCIPVCSQSNARISGLQINTRESFSASVHPKTDTHLFICTLPVDWREVVWSGVVQGMVVVLCWLLWV